jgi:hypothetical protein
MERAFKCTMVKNCITNKFVMIFYQFSTIGGLMIDIRPYQDILTANVINDGIEIYGS